jgi:hypothetical protein
MAIICQNMSGLNWNVLIIENPLLHRAFVGLLTYSTSFISFFQLIFSFSASLVAVSFHSYNFFTVFIICHLVYMAKPSLGLNVVNYILLLFFDHLF